MPTRSPPRPQTLSPRLLGAALSVTLLSTAVCACLPSAATATNFAGHAFFASVQACIAARNYEKRACINAFVNALAEIRERRLAFSSRADCVLRFRLCEKVEDGADAPAGRAFAPVLLGVEISHGPKGLLAAPVFAIETPPDLFPPKPILQATEAAGEPFAGRVNSASVREDGTRVGVRRSRNAAPRAVVKEERPRETPEQRLQRIRNAPFVD